MNEPLVLTEENFDAEVIESPGVILVDFWATWCGPCRMIAPLVEQLAREMAGLIRVGKLDVDAHGAPAARYSVMSIPTLIIFKEGQEVERVVGLRPYEDLRTLAEAHLE